MKWTTVRKSVHCGSAVWCVGQVVGGSSGEALLLVELALVVPEPEEVEPEDLRVPVVAAEAPDGPDREVQRAGTALAEHRKVQHSQRTDLHTACTFAYSTDSKHTSTTHI